MGVYPHIFIHLYKGLYSKAQTYILVTIIHCIIVVHLNVYLPLFLSSELFITFRDSNFKQKSLETHQ